MQGIVDACVSAAESIDQREVRRQEYQRQLIDELTYGKCSPNRYTAVAAIFERDARAAGLYDRFAPLIRRLGDPACERAIQPHVAVALRHIWGVS